MFYTRSQHVHGTMQTNETSQATSTEKKHKSGARKVIILLLLLIVILGAALYSQHTLIDSLLVGSYTPQTSAAPVALTLPAGFHSSLFAQNLSGPRFITFGPDGTLFATERASGDIVALPDAQHTGQASEKRVVATGLNDPTSLVFYKDALYVGEAAQVTRFTFDKRLQVTERRVIVPNLPAGGNHVTRTVLVGPDGNLYVSIGSTCNVCKETDAKRATVQVYQLDGSNGRLYTKGLRNAVGMAINPWNQQIWVTNNGRDLLGDDTPPETVYALKDGGDAGWPRCHAASIIDPDYGHDGDCNGVLPPQVKMQAHSAPLGLAFYNAAQFPRQYRGLFIAFHGSWNRSVPTGYKVVFVPLNDQGEVAGAVQDFATGWLENKATVHGRPVGLVVALDGSLYVSDDGAGMIYRITYSA
ncbi:MAG: sorbosone dehydrogenase family protein [Ktedonobacteraceae bacterium]